MLQRLCRLSYGHFDFLAKTGHVISALVLLL